MVAAGTRQCKTCGAPLPLAPRPRLHICEDCGWEPAPGPQTEFLSSNAFEAFYGGAAGGGKSEALLMDALRYVDRASYRAVLFRRTMPELRRSLIDRALKWYEKVAPGGFVSSPVPVWTFPSGAKIEFAHLQHANDVYNFDSAEIQYAGFDEASHFLESQVVYIQSRLRSSDGIPVRLRYASNPPEDMTGAWLLKRFAPWVDRGPDYHGVQARSGERLYVVHSRNVGERYVERGTIDEEGNAARARLFIQARVSDNPYVSREYRSTLLGLDPISRARKLDGDWSRMDKPGALWSRQLIDAGRVTSHPPLWRIGVGLDPSGSHRKGSDEAGIIAGGVGPCGCSGEREDHAFVTEDLSGVLPAAKQARTAIATYHRLGADFVVAEINYGGEWIEATIHEIDRMVNVQVEHVSKGKVVRAEPVQALYGRIDADGRLVGCKVHHVGTLAGLENEQCTYDPRTSTSLSPGRMDALVFVLSKLMLEGGGGIEGVTSDGERRFSDRGRSFMT